jgi:hypothetical protein
MSTTHDDDAPARVPVLMRLPDLERPRPKRPAPEPIPALVDDEEPMVHWWDQWRQAGWDHSMGLVRRIRDGLVWLVRHPKKLVRDHAGWAVLVIAVVVAFNLAAPMFRSAPPIDEDPTETADATPSGEDSSATVVAVVPESSPEIAVPPPTLEVAAPTPPPAEPSPAQMAAPAPQPPKEQFLAVQPPRPLQPGVARLTGIVLEPEPTVAEATNEQNRSSLR